ncbi:MAG: hypothetical protein D6778_03840 [Nitrospirae bacterium]|nr:MAG: hypothetical protein D6778_03840 [Nitrospirota bacterium]
MVSGEQRSNYNFADVKQLRIGPEQSYLVSQGQSLTIVHRINLGTPGSVALMTATTQAFQYILFEDMDCDETPDGPNLVPSGGYYSLNSGGALSTGAYCVILKTIVPRNTPPGTVEKLRVMAYEDWLNTTGTDPETSSAYDDQDTVTDTITVTEAISGSLRLEKWVRNVTLGETFQKTNQASPCQVLEYRIDFKNIGTSTLKDLSINDLIPEGTGLYEDQYTGATDAELVVQGNHYYGSVNDSPDTDGLTTDGTTLSVDITKMTSGAYQSLSPGVSGYLLYQVRLKGGILCP